MSLRQEVSGWSVRGYNPSYHILQVVCFSAMPSVRRGSEEEAWVVEMIAYFASVVHAERPDPVGISEGRSVELERLIITAFCGDVARYTGRLMPHASRRLYDRAAELGLKRIHVRNSEYPVTGLSDEMLAWFQSLFTAKIRAQQAPNTMSDS